MSNNKRDGKFSNSAIVCTVHVSDFSEDPLSGIAFQRTLESNAFKKTNTFSTIEVQPLDEFVYSKSIQ